MFTVQISEITAVIQEATQLSFLVNYRAFENNINPGNILEKQTLSSLIIAAAQKLSNLTSSELYVDIETYLIPEKNVFRIKLYGIEHCQIYQYIFKQA